MPDEKPKAALHSSVPKEIREFVRCRLDSVEIAPRKLDIPNLPTLTIGFEAGPKGSVKITIDAMGDFLDTSIPVSVDANGHLKADTSKIPIGRDFVDQWIEDFNADLDAPPRKKLSGISVKKGKLHVTKTSVVVEESVSVAPPPIPVPPPAHHHEGNPIPEPVEVSSVQDPGAGGPPQPPPPAHVTDPIPPPVEVESETADSGFIEDPPIGKEANIMKGLKRAFPVVILGAIGLFLVTNGDDSPATETTQPTSGAATAASATTAPAAPTTTQQVAAEPPASVSLHEDDPIGDNGGEGSGADITALEFDPVTSTITLRLADSPLLSSKEWFSYYLEVTVTRASGAEEVLIWENHAGSSRSGVLDSKAVANGLGVTLQEFGAEFQPEKNPDDPIVDVEAVAYSLVDENSTFTQDAAALQVEAS